MLSVILYRSRSFKRSFNYWSYSSSTLFSSSQFLPISTFASQIIYLVPAAACFIIYTLRIRYYTTPPLPPSWSCVPLRPSTFLCVSLRLSPSHSPTLSFLFLLSCSDTTRWSWRFNLRPPLNGGLREGEHSARPPPHPPRLLQYNRWVLAGWCWCSGGVGGCGGVGGWWW